MIPQHPLLDISQKKIEGLDISDLINSYGSPLLVISERIIRIKYKQIREALDKHYPNSCLAYSFSANYLPGTLTVMRDLGLSAEVGSAFEFWLAKKLDFSPDKIIYNGARKLLNDPSSAYSDILLHIDNWSDAEYLGALSKKWNKKFSVGLRMNLEIGSLPASRFGFSINKGLDVIRMFKQWYPLLEVESFQVHLGTNINSIECYSEASEKLADFAIKAQKDYGVMIKYIDLGGGFAAPGSRWKDNSIWIVPEIEEYVSAISRVLNKKFVEKKPVLILEPGRFLIDESGVFLTTVLDVQTRAKVLLLPDEVNRQKIQKSFNPDLEQKVQIATVDSSASSVPKSAFVRHKRVEIISDKNGSKTEKNYHTYIAGSSSLENDFLAWDTFAPKLYLGDFVLFFNCGAYTVSRSEQFMQPRPAVVLVNENGKSVCIRQKERFEDLTMLDKF